MKQLNKNKNRLINNWVKKIKLINYLGGVCRICGENDVRKLTFHHIDPLKKERKISDIKGNHLDNLTNEVNKCEVLCNNCHREYHFLENNKITKQGEERRFNKKLFLEYKGDICVECGYKKCISALTFHHANRNTKKFDIGSNGKKFKSIFDLDNEIRNELDKCVVLCANCHFIKDIDNDIFEYSLSNINNISIREKSRNLDYDIVYDLFFNKKMKQIEIVKILNSKKSTISTIVKNLIKKHSLKKERNIKYDRDLIYDLFFNKKMRQVEISKMLNCNRSVISRIIKEIDNK